MRRDIKRVKASGADAKQSLRDDAAVESALSREMTLTAFGPSLNGVRHMVAQQSGLGVAVQEVERPLCVAHIECSSQRVERRAVPESLVAGLRQHAVHGPQSRREQCVERSRGFLVDAHHQRDANPRAEHVVALIINIGIEALNRSGEVGVDILAQLLCLSRIGLGKGGRLAHQRSQIAC